LAVEQRGDRSPLTGFSDFLSEDVENLSSAPTYSRKRSQPAPVVGGASRTKERSR
jgi:hypothetical protein